MQQFSDLVDVFDYAKAWNYDAHINFQNKHSGSLIIASALRRGPHGDDDISVVKQITEEYSSRLPAIGDMLSSPKWPFIFGELRKISLYVYKTTLYASYTCIFCVDNNNTPPLAVTLPMVHADYWLYPLLLKAPMSKKSIFNLISDTPSEAVEGWIEQCLSVINKDFFDGSLKYSKQFINASYNDAIDEAAKFSIHEKTIEDTDNDETTNNFTID